MPWAAVLRVPQEWRQRIMDLRNSYIRDNQTAWSSPLEYAAVLRRVFNSCCQ
jgi:hypothetical protein